MADPITIIGLVSGIITFVEFGLKITSGAKNIRNSLHGTTPDVTSLNQNLSKIIRDLQLWNDLLKERKSRGVELSYNESSMEEMIAQCEKLHKHVQKAIQTLKMRAEARSRTVESMRVATRTFLKADKIRALEFQLNNLAERIRRSIENEMREDRDSSILASLAEIKGYREKTGVVGGSRLDEILEDIRHSAKQIRHDGEMRSAMQSAQLTSLKTKLEVLQQERDICSRQNKVLRSLYYPEIRRRWIQIRDADQRSNEWIYDSRQTSFVSWLESKREGDSLFYITGRAGSGKSTLMKFVYEDQRTAQSLEEWAGTMKLYRASYYFWNQGTEMQKSAVGLFQSLLYQILKSAPDLILPVCQGHLDHELWEIEDLKKVFKRIAERAEVDAKFCFFIDGLDEYDGEEKDVINLLRELSVSRHIKICTSSRPGRQYERFLQSYNRKFDIAHFTKGDMRRYISAHLQASEKWRRLVRVEPGCQNIINEISARAGGVWLWVSLVTDDIVREAEKNETVATLRKVVDEFPDELHEYFERMIEKIPKIHREEMAQIFLVAVEELQPLPLFAFALLEEERRNSEYAMSAPIMTTLESEIEVQYPALTDRIRNRCSDLLIVDDQPHPVFLSYSVDFLHRTVRDFLRDYDGKLKTWLKAEFDPLVSLSRICFRLLKMLPITNLRDHNSANKVIGLTDELLYYAREIEKRSSPQEETPLIPLLDELDVVNSRHAKGISNHWTHVRDSPSQRGLDIYSEGGRYNFLALTVQARLVKYVRAKLREDPRKIQKAGRPLLDYALRPRRITPISMPYHSTRADPSVDVDMVKLLLSNGASPNQPVFLNGGRSVWACFLLSINVTYGRDGSAASPTYRTLNDAWYQACDELIKAGARADCLADTGSEDVSASSILRCVFGEGRASALEQAMKAKEDEVQQSGSSCILI
ncbi:hypothetical protein F5Y03DRAFT_378532 [Xylaria venustula]|nr:hypothetical protein F5Y03DRAFT_378532 [Xylaria venustula]